MKISSAFGVCALALLVSAARPEETQGRAKEPPASLDELAARSEPARGPDGRDQWHRAFAKAIAWKDYLRALAAEQAADPAVVIDAGLDPGVPAPDAVAACTPPDSDYDGDTFIGADDTFPLRRGEYVADRPRIRAQFTSYVDAKLDYRYTGSTTITHDETRFYETDLIERTDVKDTREFKKKFNGSLGLKLGFSSDKKPVIGLDLGLGGEVERQRSYSWTRTKTQAMERKYTDIRHKVERSEISLEANSGRVSGQVTLYNESDYALDVDVSNVRIAVVAYSPFTGAKYALGDVVLTGTFPLGYGSGNNSASSFVDLAGLNTFDMMNRLAEGWVFDMEIASYTAIDRNTGNNVGSVISRVNQRNSRLSIHYGDTTARQYGQVSVFQPSNQCLTGQNLLLTYVGAANVEFDRMPDGTLIVKRINHRTNRFADRDFSSLTPAEQAQYGRWVVGYQYYNQPLTTFDLETTLLAPEDKVFFYYLTAADFQEDPPPPDVTAAHTVANDGTSTLTQLVQPVSAYDTVELYVKSTFRIDRAYSRYLGNIYNARCGIIYKATWYGHEVAVDSTLHNTTVPNVDWYGVQVDFGGLGYGTLASILADPAAQGSVTSFRGFPDYDYVVRFRVTPAMLGSYPTRNLFIKSANPRQSFRVGYEGYNVAGQRVSCRWDDPGGFYHNDATTKIWWKLDNADADGDGFLSVARTGIDFDDANPRRFPYAPEHLDGLDNNGDASVDNGPMLCPAAIQAWHTGTCKLDNRLGWYSANPSTYLEQRWRRTDGTFTAWTTVGSNLTSYTFTMPSDPALSALQLRMTHYASGSTAYSGTNTVDLLPGTPPPLSVAINGPTHVYHPSQTAVAASMRIPPIPPNTYTWTASVSGGAAPFTCAWTKTTPSGTTSVGSACTYTESFYYDGSCTTNCTTQFSLTVTVRDQASQSASVSKTVTEHHSGTLEP